MSLSANTNIVKSHSCHFIAIKNISSISDQRIIHADIKPANFMVNTYGNNILISSIDFGYSKKLKEGETTIIDDPAGTPLYIAPEIIEFRCDSEGNKNPYILPLRRDGVFSKSEVKEALSSEACFTNCSIFSLSKLALVIVVNRASVINLPAFG